MLSLRITTGAVILACKMWEGRDKCAWRFAILYCRVLRAYLAQDKEWHVFLSQQKVLNIFLSDRCPCNKRVDDFRDLQMLDNATKQTLFLHGS